MKLRVALFLAQLSYTLWICCESTDLVFLGVGLSGHFVGSNLLHASFIVLFAYSQFVAAEVVLLINLANLTWAYFLFHSYPRFIHLSVVSGPLAWTYIAVYWNVALLVPQHNVAGQVIGSLCIWSIMGFGLFLLITFKVQSLQLLYKSFR